MHRSAALTVTVTSLDYQYLLQKISGGNTKHTLERTQYTAVNRVKVSSLLLMRQSCFSLDVDAEVYIKNGQSFVSQKPVINLYRRGGGVVYVRQCVVYFGHSVAGKNCG